MRKHRAGNISRQYSYHSTSPHREGREREGGGRWEREGAGQGRGKREKKWRAKKVTSDREEIGALVCAVCVIACVWFISVNWEQEISYTL